MAGKQPSWAEKQTQIDSTGNKCELVGSYQHSVNAMLKAKMREQGNTSRHFGFRNSQARKELGVTPFPKDKIFAFHNCWL
ncbi:MAG: hypothetical protein FRX49_13211 [Trebouxia sp. A1-2]|nr:MAG: hypothetical protein FRX49_13211 [Trebouxia sp. A1-2]